MIEIIPNWHPIFVHFPIALLTIATLFHVVAAFNSKSANYYQFENVANWNLWLGAAFAVVTAVAGWLAFNSVEHDTPSHEAMLDHRNWALTTTVVFIVLAIWSFRRIQKAVPISWLLTIPLILASGLLVVTGYEGGELVYRHGLGVMSLPDTGAHDHAGHEHGGHDHSTEGMEQEESGTMLHSEAEHEVGEADHEHEHGSDHQHSDSGEPAMDSSTVDTEEPASGDGHDHDHDHDHTH